MFNGESITIKLILKLEKDQKNMTLFRAACCLSSTQSFVIPSKFSSQEIVPKGVQRFLQTIVHIGLCRHVGIFISTVECICCKIKMRFLWITALFLLTPILFIHFQSVSVSRQIFLYTSSNTKNPPNNYESCFMFLSLLVVLPFFIWVLLGCLVFKNGFIFLDLTPI